MFTMPAEASKSPRRHQTQDLPSMFISMSDLQPPESQPSACGVLGDSVQTAITADFIGHQLQREPGRVWETCGELKAVSHGNYSNVYKTLQRSNKIVLQAGPLIYARVGLPTHTKRPGQCLLRHWFLNSQLSTCSQQIQEKCLADRAEEEMEYYPTAENTILIPAITQ